MSLVLLTFVICVSRDVGAANFFLPIPYRFGLIVGNESYRISLDPDIGSPSPPPKSLRKKQNIIFISDALPGARYKVDIHHTNSMSNNIEMWRGTGYTSPLPPTNLTVDGFKKDDNSVVLNWSPPKYGLFSKYLLTVHELSDQARTPLYDNKPLIKNFTSFPLRNLVSGGSYEARVRTVSEYEERVFESETFASVIFTLKPEPPDKFILFFRNETTLIIMWHPPRRPTVSTGYKAFIIPPPKSVGESSIFLKKQIDSSADAPKAMFTNLVPGRTYNLYVQTVSGNEYSSEVVDQFRTTPLPPSSLTYDSNSVTARSVLVRWQPPKGACEFDAYRISTNDSSITPIIRFRNQSTVYKLSSEDGLLPGRTYQITVKTLSAKADSKPVSTIVTFRPLPVINLQSIVNVSMMSNNRSILSDEWNKELIACSIKWRVSNRSSQDHFKIAYFETQFQNGDSDTKTVNSNVRELNLLLLPGRNYSIVVRALSHGMESGMARIHQITRPSTPSIDKIIFNQTYFSVTWQSYVDSRQAYYEVNVTSDDPLKVKCQTKITTEAKFSTSTLCSGAAYNVSIVSVNQAGLKSAPEVYKHVVYPKPPDKVAVVEEDNSNNSLTVRWQAPTNTIFSAFVLSYRIGGDSKLQHGPTILKSNITRAYIQPAIRGEMYEIRVTTVTHDDVECFDPQVITYVLPPSPVTNIIRFEEGTNSTSVDLRFERPSGRVDYYEIMLVDTGAAVKILKNVTGGNNYLSNSVRLSLPNLKPGTEYRLYLTSVSGGRRSIPGHAVTRLRPWITSRMTIVVPDDNEYDSTTSLTLKYTPTSSTLTYFDTYKFQISDSSFATRYRARPTVEADGEITFDNLTSGRLYVIRMWTIAGGVTSARPLEKKERLHPQHVDHIRAKTITNHSIELVWDEPDGEYDDFEVVHYSTFEGNLSTMTTVQPFVVFDTLKPYRQYTFTITVRSGTENHSSILRYSKRRSATFTTHESVPGRIENFRPVRVQPSQIKFDWNLPNASRNGILSRYVLTYNLDDSSVADRTLDILPALARVTIGGLEPGREYVFAIRAETKIGFGPSTEWIQKMPIDAPPQPNSQIVPKVVRKGVQTIEIQFRKDFFSEQNGPIIGYTVIVAEDVTKNMLQRATLPAWSAIHSIIGKWPPYRAVEPFYPFTNDTVTNFTIGLDDHCAQLATTCCNGPLKSGSTYYIKIRAFTSPEKYADTAYSLPITTDTKEVSLKDVLKKQLYANSMYIGLIGFCLIIFSICFCEGALRTSWESALNRNEIRLMGRHMIHSTAARTSDPVPQQHHPFENQFRNLEQQISYSALPDQRMMQRMKLLFCKEESDHYCVGTTNSFPNLSFPAKATENGFSFVGRYGVPNKK